MPFLIIFSNFVFSIINPFNADDFDDANASAAINAAFGPFYGGMPKGEPRAQDQIVLVLFQDSSLKSAGNPFWPPSYHYQQEILKTIANYKPAAIFIDFVYDHAHPAQNSSRAPDLSGVGVFADLQNTRVNKNLTPSTDLVNFAAAISTIRNGDIAKDISPIPVFTGPVSNDPLLEPLRKVLGAENTDNPTTVSLSTKRPPAKAGGFL